MSLLAISKNCSSLFTACLMRLEKLEVVWMAHWCIMAANNRSSFSSVTNKQTYRCAMSPPYHCIQPLQYTLDTSPFRTLLIETHTHIYIEHQLDSLSVYSVTMYLNASSNNDHRHASTEAGKSILWSRRGKSSYMYGKGSTHTQKSTVMGRPEHTILKR